MKFYKRDPARAFEGMRELTLEQIGAYNLILDLLYARDGIVPDDDGVVAHMLSRDVRLWRRLKRELMAAGKIRVTNDGLLTANGVDVGLLDAQVRSQVARSSVTHRWDLYRLAKEINGGAIRPHYDRNTSKRQSKNSEIPSPREHAKPLAVDNGDNDFGAVSQTTEKSIGTGELKAALRAKGWI